MKSKQAIVFHNTTIVGKNTNSKLSEFEVESVVKSKEGANLYWLVDSLSLRNYAKLIGEEFLKQLISNKDFKSIKC